MKLPLLLLLSLLFAGCFLFPDPAPPSDHIVGIYWKHDGSGFYVRKEYKDWTDSLLTYSADGKLLNTVNLGSLAVYGVAASDTELYCAGAGDTTLVKISPRDGSIVTLIPNRTIIAASPSGHTVLLSRESQYRGTLWHLSVYRVEHGQFSMVTEWPDAAALAKPVLLNDSLLTYTIALATRKHFVIEALDHHALYDEMLSDQNDVEAISDAPAYNSVFAAYPDTRIPTLQRIDLSTGRKSHALDDPFSLTTAPDGYHAFYPYTALRVRNLITEHERDIASDNPWLISVSPDAKLVAYATSDAQMHVVNVGDLP